MQEPFVVTEFQPIGMLQLNCHSRVSGQSEIRHLTITELPSPCWEKAQRVSNFLNLVPNASFDFPITSQPIGLELAPHVAAKNC